MSSNEVIEIDELDSYIQGVVMDFQNGDLSEPLRECAPVVRQSIRDNFTSSASPDGESWPERVDPGDGHPLLIDTGDMMQAATGGGPGGVFRSERNELEIGVDLDIVPYARRHNYGNEDGKMPQREFLGAKEEHLDDCEEIISEHVAENWF